MKKLWLLAVMLLLCATITWAQRVVTGQVLSNETKAPLQGVSILIKNTKTGTTTDENGNFRLPVPSNAKTLVVSITGFSSKEINLSGAQNNYEVALETNVQAMNEVVVVVAYGEQERKKVTGSIGKLSGKQVENVPFTSVDQILQGKIAGLQSVATSGQPGAAQQIRIRGIGSISASSAPLFVVDGMPINTGDASNLTNSSNLLANINPNDIESISVLKDASAASIYGSRAANGVIIINTKKGRAGKTIVRADAELGSNDIAYMPDAGKPLNKDEVNALFREGIVNAGFSGSDVDFIMENFFGYNTASNYNWLDLVKRKGKQQQVNLSASGGDSKTQFFLSGGYFKQQSPIIGADLKRYTTNINLSHQLSQRVSVGVNLNLSSFKQMGESESANFRNPIIASMALLPWQKAFNEDGSPNYDPTVFTQIYNPVAIRQYDKQ
ncbi:MAG TPA: TonB-dependent receptor plug domain-containing protein, partial [Flavisolibacter sp.]|nr:TonB-dependent receptor plug domain-containing protein [Flavisolibacter sp.]